MTRNALRTFLAALLALTLAACQPPDPDPESSNQPAAESTRATESGPEAQPAADGTAAGESDHRPLQAAKDFERDRLDIYAPFELSADLSHLSAGQKAMLGKLIEAGKIMDELFWRQAFGDPQPLLGRITDAKLQRFAGYNYGPWDRLAGNEPFLAGFGPKPDGANYYPADMTRAEFGAWDNPDKEGLYSLVRRNDAGELHLHPYNVVFEDRLRRAAGLLREAAGLAANESFATYLRLRADAFESNQYRHSDMAWMDVEGNAVDVVIGPIETYEDQLFGYRAAFEAFVLIKDQAWSERLSKFTQFLPQLQEGLPVSDEYKQEEPGREAELNTYDAVYYAGDANAGAKTIAINLPNDEQVQLEKGTRRLQLKNAMRAKFDQILVPISELLIAAEQREHVTFDAFFANTMFHEVAHGLGIKNTINGEGTVRAALKEHASAIEEGKADILGLYMIQQLRKMGELEDGELMDNYVSFMASIFRSVRFGASSAHGKANMVRFNYFREQGAFTRDMENGTYRVDVDAFESAVEDLARLILTIQGDGDYVTAGQLLDEQGRIKADLREDLERLAAAEIPVDIVFEQGKDVLGLE